jgi:hypothetical protein
MTLKTNYQSETVDETEAASFALHWLGTITLMCQRPVSQDGSYRAVLPPQLTI